MIQYKLHFYIAIIFVISLISCDNEPYEGFEQPQDGGGGSELNAVFEATLSDTIDFSANEITAELTEDGLQFSGTMNNKRIGFVVPNPTIGPKDFSSIDADGFYKSNVEEINSEFYTAQQGVLDMENIDTTSSMISGTFFGDFVEISSNDTLSITEGVFSEITFVNNTSSQDEATGGSLSVDIDGETNTFELSENNFPDDQDVAVYSFIQVNEDNQLNSKVIKLVLPSNLNQGSFDINNFQDQGSVLNPYSIRYDNPADSSIFNSIEDTGQINLDTVSESTIEGTFNFDGQNIVNEEVMSFTNGSFTIELN